MRRLVLAALATGLLVAPAPAAADPSATFEKNAEQSVDRLERMKVIADRRFPAVTARCGYVFVGAAPLSVDDPTVAAEAWEPCAVHLAARWERWPRSELCVTVVHEYGHLAGLEHSTDPRDVMNEAAAPYTVPACARLWRAEERRRDLIDNRAWLRTARQLANYRRALVRIGRVLGP